MASQSNLPRWTNNRWLPILIALISLTCTVVGLELAARTVYAPQTVYREPDPVLGWRLKPNFRAEIRKPEYRVEIAMNSAGWRDVEHTIEKPAHTYRILVLGDSYMEAYAVPFEHMLARQLQQHFNEIGDKNIEVLNFGVGGYGTLQETLAYEQYGVQYDPDLILLGFYAGNDLEDNSLAISRELWGSDAPEVYGRPFLVEKSGKWTIQPPDYARAVKASESPSLWENLALVQMGTIFMREQNAEPHLWDGAYLCNPSPEYAEAWQITGQAIGMLHDDADQHGATLIVFYVPAREEVDLPHMQKLLDKSNAPQDFCFDPSISTRQLQMILDEQGIPFINLLPVFIDATRQGGAELFYQQDRHWNAAGHTLAVRIIFDALQERGIGK